MQYIEKDIETSEENLFIAAACAEKGIDFLEGKAIASVRKITDEEPSVVKEGGKQTGKASNYTIVLNGE